MSGHALTRSPTPRLPKPRAGGLEASVPLTVLLDAWVADQLITPEQADRIMVRGDVLVQAPPAERERPHGGSSLVIEALGYLGGVIMLVASILIASLYWTEVGITTRLVIVGGASAVLLGAGFAIPERLGDAGDRLRSVLWLVSTGAFAGFMGLLSAHQLDLSGADAFALISAAVAAFAVGLWLIGPTMAQQMAMMVGLMLTAAALTNELSVSDALPGLAVWGVALIWLLLGWGGLLEPRRFVVVFGAAGMFAGAMTTIPTYGGIGLSLATSVAVVATAVLFRDLLLLAVGALGTLLVLPSSVIELFPGQLAAPIAMLVVGALLVGAGLYVAGRRHTSRAAPPSHDFSVGTPRTALTASGVAGATVTAVIVALAVI